MDGSTPPDFPRQKAGGFFWQTLNQCWSMKNKWNSHPSNGWFTTMNGVSDFPNGSSLWRPAADW